MPVIQRYFEEAGSAVQILAVNLTTNESSPKEVEEFLRREGYTFPVALDVDGSAAKALYDTLHTYIFFIDEDGVIRRLHVGPLSREMIEESSGRCNSSIRLRQAVLEDGEELSHLVDFGYIDFRRPEGFFFLRLIQDRPPRVYDHGVSAEGRARRTAAPVAGYDIHLVFYSPG